MRCNNMISRGSTCTLPEVWFFFFCRPGNHEPSHVIHPQWGRITPPPGESRSANSGSYPCASDPTQWFRWAEFRPLISMREDRLWPVIPTPILCGQICLQLRAMLFVSSCSFPARLPNYVCTRPEREDIRSDRSVTHAQSSRIYPRSLFSWGRVNHPPPCDGERERFRECEECEGQRGKPTKRLGLETARYPER